MKRFKAKFTYEVKFGDPEFINAHDEVTEEAIAYSWHECEPDIVYTAAQSGEPTGFIEWGTDDEGKWAVADMDCATTNVSVTYGTVQYYTQEIICDYEGADNTPEALYVDEKTAATLNDHPVVVEALGTGE